MSFAYAAKAPAAVSCPSGPPGWPSGWPLEPGPPWPPGEWPIAIEAGDYTLDVDISTHVTTEDLDCVELESRILDEFGDDTDDLSCHWIRVSATIDGTPVSMRLDPADDWVTELLLPAVNFEGTKIGAYEWVYLDLDSADYLKTIEWSLDIPTVDPVVENEAETFVLAPMETELVVDASDTYIESAESIFPYGNHIYVAARGSDRVSKFLKADLSLVSSINNSTVFANLYSLAEDGGYLFSIESGGYIGEIRLSDFSLTRSYDIPSVGGAQLAVAVDSNYVYGGGDTNSRLTRVNRLSFVADGFLSSASALDGIREILIRDGYLWVLASDDDMITRISVASFSIVDSLSDVSMDTASSMAFGDSYLGVLSYVEDIVTFIDPEDFSIAGTVSGITSNSGSEIKFADGYFYVTASGSPGQIRRIREFSMELVETYSDSAGLRNAGCFCVSGGFAYCSPDDGTGNDKLSKINLGYS